MKYNIISAVRNQSTITTVVKVENEGVEEFVTISHFNPSSIEVIHENITNRILSDINQKNAERICDEVLLKIELNTDIEI